MEVVRKGYVYHLKWMRVLIAIGGGLSGDTSPTGITLKFGATKSDDSTVEVMDECADGMRYQKMFSRLRPSVSAITALMLLPVQTQAQTTIEGLETFFSGAQIFSEPTLVECKLSGGTEALVSPFQ